MLISPLYYGSTDKFGTTILTHLFARTSAENPPQSTTLRPVFHLVRTKKSTPIWQTSFYQCFLHYDQDVKTRKIHVPSKAPPPPLRGTSPAAAGEALWAANRTSALSIAAHPVKKNSSIAKIMQIYTIGGLRASKQTLAEQVSKACDSPPTHF